MIALHIIFRLFDRTQTMTMTRSLLLNGQPTDPGAFPFVARGGVAALAGDSCVATLIASDILLTVAGCQNLLPSVAFVDHDGLAMNNNDEGSLVLPVVEQRRDSVLNLLVSRRAC